MTAQEKLAFGMIAFLIIFMVGLFVIPPSIYQRYLADLERRKRRRFVKPLLAVVFLLSVPYFYDQLIGWDSRALSELLGFTIGACAYLVLIDVAWWVYKNCGPPSQRPRRARK